MDRSDRIAKRIIASPYYSLMNYLMNFENDKFQLKVDIGRKLSGSTWVVHHFNSPSKYIHQKMDSKTKDDIINVLEGKESKTFSYDVIEKELNGIVIIPKWFHDYIGTNNINYDTKQEFRKGYLETLKNQSERNKVKRLKYYGRAFEEKLKTILAIYMTLPPEERVKIHKKLDPVYESILEIIDKLDIEKYLE